MARTTKYSVRCIIAINANLQAQANTWWKNNIDPDGGEFTFTREISRNGRPPAQGYVCETSLTMDHLDQVAEFTEGRGPNEVELIIYPQVDGVTPAEIRERITVGPNVRVLPNRVPSTDIVQRFGMQFVETEEV